MTAGGRGVPGGAAVQPDARRQFACCVGVDFAEHREDLLQRAPAGLRERRGRVGRESRGDRRDLGCREVQRRQRVLGVDGVAAGTPGGGVDRDAGLLQRGQVALDRARAHLEPRRERGCRPRRRGDCPQVFDQRVEPVRAVHGPAPYRPRKRAVAPKHLSGRLDPWQSQHLFARGVTVTRGPVVVLDGIDLTIAEHDTIGLIGPNGVGKTTLLRTLAGQIAPDRGAVERTPPTATVGYLPQERNRGHELVTDYLHRRTGATDASAELDAATAALAAGEHGADTRYDAALTRWLSLGVADLPARLGEVWSELSLQPELLEQPTSSLSGGEAARVGLAALLLSRFDVYLLDEPTNDLDLDGLAMLERWIGELRAGVVLVSHDRTFLARTVDSVVEIDEFTHTATRFTGGWQAYLDERAAAERHAWERFEEYDAQRSSTGRARPARTGVGDPGPGRSSSGPARTTRTSVPSG